MLASCLSSSRTSKLKPSELKNEWCPADLDSHALLCTPLTASLKGSSMNKHRPKSVNKSNIFCFVLFFETGFPCVTVLALYTRLTLNSQRSICSSSQVLESKACITITWFKSNIFNTWSIAAYKGIFCVTHTFTFCIY